MRRRYLSLLLDAVTRSCTVLGLLLTAMGTSSAPYRAVSLTRHQWHVLHLEHLAHLLWLHFLYSG